MNVVMFIVCLVLTVGSFTCLVVSVLSGHPEYTAVFLIAALVGGRGIGMVLADWL